MPTPADHLYEGIITEKKDLDEKLAKLKAFCLDPVNLVFDKMDRIDRNLLEGQYTAMSLYSYVLSRRIERCWDLSLKACPDSNSDAGDDLRVVEYREVI